MPMIAALPTYISLQEAAVRYSVSETVLRRAVEDGIIRAVRLTGGKITVANEDTAIVAAQTEAMANGDELVSLNQAAHELGIYSHTVWRWYKHGWLEKRGDGPRNAILISLKDVQKLYQLYQRRGGQRGKRLIPRNMEVNEAITSLM